MKNVILTVTGILLIISCSTVGVSNIAPEHSVTIHSTSSKTTDDDIQRIYDEALRSLDKICSTLEIDHSIEILIMITDEGICTSRGGFVTLPVWHVANRKAAVTHEITHLVTRHDGNRFYAEGLAIFFQERYGSDKAFPNFEGRELDDLVRERKSDYIPLTELYENNSIFKAVGSEAREMAYLEAGSFMTFLYDEYGRKKFTALHDMGELDYEEIYGKDLAELEKKWKKSLATSSFSMTFSFRL